MKTDQNQQDYLSIVTNKVCARIKLDDIEMIEQAGRKICIFTKDEEFMCYDRLETLAPVLVNRSFYRAKKGLVVNFARVVRLQAQEITFDSGRIYCIGRNNYVKTKSAFKNYLLGYPPFVNDGLAFNVADDKDDFIA